MSEDNIRVLIVDDEDGVRTGMKKYLEDGNFYVDVAANGKEALTLLNQNKGGYDVALLDHLLVPKPNGIELMKIIKEKYPNIECIIMTGWGSDSRQRAIKAGAFRYIEKPFDSQELVMLIQFAAQQVRIQQISRDILSGISLHQVLSRVIATAKSLSMADFAVIRIFDKTINGFRTYSGDQGETINHVADEEALFHEIMSSGKTVSVPNIHTHENQIHHPVDPSMHSFLGVPIPGGEVHLGVLCVYHHEPEYFDTHETRTILKTLADQVGLVITKAIAFQEIRSHSRYMQALVKAAEGFAQAESTHDLAQLAWTFVKEQLCVSTFFIGLYDQTSRKLTYLLAYDEGKPITLDPKRIDRRTKGISAYIVREGTEKCWQTADDRSDECKLLNIDPIQHGRQCQSCFYLPLKINDIVVGVMSIQSYERFQFSQILLDAFRSLGSQLVVALKNLWLIDGQEKAYNQLYGLNDVVFEISKGLDQPHLLETIIQKATQLLSAQGGAIYLLDSRQKQLELKAATGLSKQMNGHIISRDEGLCGRILKTGRAQVRHNYRQWKHRLEELDSLEFKAVAGSLIKMGDRPLGVIIVDDTRPDKKFYPEDLKILQVFANHAGLALQRAEFFEKEQVIHKIVSAITSDSDLESVFSYICLAAFELFGVDHSGLVLFDDSYDWGTVAGEYPSSIGTLGARIRLSGVKAEEMLIQSAAPLNFPDLEQVKSDLGEVYELMHGFNIFSTLIVPIEYQGRVLGSFSLDTISRYRNFESEEIELCKVFALTVATAIENARLLKELHKQGNYIRSLFKASTSVFSTNEPNDIIQQIVETTRKATGAWKVAVILTSPNNDPEYIVHSGFDEDIKAITTMRSGGISEQVLRDGTPEFFGNISEHRSGVNPNMIADDVKAAACLPLSSRDRRLGILWVQFSQPQVFSQEEQHALQIFASQAAVVIENARFYNQNLKFQDHAHNLNISLDLGETLNYACQSAVEILQADRSSIVLFDDNLIEGQVLGEYPPSGTLGQIIPLRGIPVEERLLETKKPLIINDVASELSQLGEAGEILLKYGVQSVVIFPVVAKDKTLLGSIGIDSIKQKRLFSEEDIRQGNIFANQIATAIENAKLYERQKRREELYKRLNDALRSIRGEYDPIRLLHETLNLAIKLSDCSGGCIYINLPHSEMLELVIVSGIPQDQVGLMVSHQNSLAGMVVQTGRPRVYDHNNREGNSDFMLLKHDFVAMAGIPIGQFGQVEAVVIVADKNPHRQFSGTDLEILTRFAEQGAIALNTSRSFGADRRIHSQLDILRQINEYILKTPDDLEKILNVFLTSVTAGYGLQFNRAALFLMDEQGEYLKGRIGIGYLNEDEARDSWRSDPVKNFSDYIHHLESNILHATPLDEQIRALEFPATGDRFTNFIQMLQEQRCILANQEQAHRMPSSFLQTFEPAFPLVMIPLIVQDKFIGLLVADNKFSQLPITPANQEALYTLVEITAIAISNARHLRDIRTSQERLDALYSASTQLVVSSKIDKVTKNIVDHACRAINADEVIFLASNNQQEFSNLYSSSDATIWDLNEVWVEECISVLRSGHYQRLTCPHEKPGSESTNGVAICLRVATQKYTFGVLIICFRENRALRRGEIEAMQLFSNQAALVLDSSKRIHELEHLHKAAEELASESEIPGVLKQIVISARNVLGANSAVIWSYDNENGLFIPNEMVADAVDPQIVEKYRKDHPKPGGTARKVIEKHYLAVTDVGDPEFAYLGIDSSGLRGSIGVKAFQGIELKVGDETLGVLYVNYNETRTFSDEEKITLETFAYHATLALKRARLLRKITSIADQIMMVRDGASQVAHSTTLEDLRTTLNAIIRTIQEICHCSTVTLYTYNHETEQFRHVIAHGYENRTSLRQPDQITDDSSLWKILNLEDPYYHLTLNAPEDELLAGEFVQNEGIVSALGMQLRYEGKPVGVLFLNYRTEYQFDDQLTNIQLFADQAAVAIRNAKYHEETLQRANRLDLLYKAGKELSRGQHIDELLAQIAKNAYKISEHLQYRLGEPILFCNVSVLKENHLEVRTIYPEESQPGVDSGVREIYLNSSGPTSITGKAALTQKTVVVPNVLFEEDYLEFDHRTNSEMAVPIIIGDHVFGVINLEHSKPNAFEEEDEKVIEALASQASLAIDNVQTYIELENRFNELRQHKGFVGSQTTVKWMKMILEGLNHSISGEAGKALVGIRLSRDALLEEDIPRALEELENIKNPINEIKNIPMEEPLSSDGVVKSIPINTVLREYMDTLWMHPGYAAVQLNLSDIDDRTKPTVRASKAWLRQLFKILADNAVQAMTTHDTLQKILTIQSHTMGSEIEILFEDTGPGIPNELKETLFEKRIYKKKGESGMGIGLVLARTVIEAYEGNIRLLDSPAGGTSIMVTLPVENNE